MDSHDSVKSSKSQIELDTFKIMQDDSVFTIFGVRKGTDVAQIKPLGQTHVRRLVAAQLIVDFASVVCSLCLSRVQVLVNF